jgi:predicted GTPase
MQGYLSDDILAFVGVINITLVDVTIVNNLIPIANQLNTTQDNITSILAQSKIISDNQVIFNDLLGSVNSGISFQFIYL